MKIEEKREFLELLEKVVNETIEPEEWDKFDKYLSQEKEARDIYRTTQASEVDLTNYYKQKKSNQTQAFQIEEVKKVKKNYLSYVIAALILIALIPFAFLNVSFPSKKLPLPSYLAKESYAVITELTGISQDQSEHKLRLHAIVGREKIKFKSGLVRLEYFNGAIVELKGPCEFYIQSSDKSFLNLGKVSAKITEDSIGFKIFSPGASLVDIGTEFALEVNDEKKTFVHVFDGEAEVSLLNDSGETIRSHSLFEKEELYLDPTIQKIEKVSQGKEFLRIQSKPQLELPNRDAILSLVKNDAPQYSWKFENKENLTWGKNILESDLELLALKQSKTESWLTEKPLSNFKTEEYSIEFWFNSESIHRGALVSLVKGMPNQTIKNWNEITPNHLVYIELCSQVKDAMHSGGKLRFLHREPSGKSGGLNLFSKVNYIPGKWHHVVATRKDKEMKLFFDGKFQGEVKLNTLDNQEDYFLYLGALDPARNKDRSFKGKMDAVSLYDYALTKDQVLTHYLSKFPST